jgi:hypothetical protein
MIAHHPVGMMPRAGGGCSIVVIAYPERQGAALRDALAKAAAAT